MSYCTLIETTFDVPPPVEIETGINPYKFWRNEAGMFTVNTDPTALAGVKPLPLTTTTALPTTLAVVIVSVTLLPRVTCVGVMLTIDGVGTAMLVELHQLLLWFWKGMWTSAWAPVV